LAGFDTETTGPNPETDRIVSASLVIDKPGKAAEVNEWLIQPAIPIELQATAVHGISDEHAAKFGMDARLGIQEIILALSTIDYPLIVVNAVFDFTLLVNEAVRYGLDATAIVDRLLIVDTLVCDRWLDMYRPGRRTLTAVAASYGIPIKGAHTASGDVLCAIKLARAMGQRFPQFGSADLTALQGLQAEAYKEWADNFAEFRQMEDPNFTVPSDWPYRPVLISQD
jgi:DNA polymerase-3 subunit epsilon